MKVRWFPPIKKFFKHEGFPLPMEKHKRSWIKMLHTIHKNTNSECDCFRSLVFYETEEGKFSLSDLNTTINYENTIYFFQNGNFPKSRWLKNSNFILTIVYHIWVRYIDLNTVLTPLYRPITTLLIKKLTFSNWSMIREGLWERCCQMKLSEDWTKIRSFLEV